MSQKPDHMRIITAWTNGKKAEVQLLEDSAQKKVILKTYRPGFLLPMFREYLVTEYVSRKLSIVPKVLAFQPLRKRLFLSFIAGQRVLEWVLQRYGAEGLVLSDFQSFHGLESNEQVARAFSRFRQSGSEEAQDLKRAIMERYRSLHRIRIRHGTTDPRNIIYDGTKAFILDFDHARPSLNPAKCDQDALDCWFGKS